MKIKNPQKGEERLVYKIVNFNDVTNRYVVEVQNLPNWNKSILPTEVVSVDDVVNVDYENDLVKCKFKDDPTDFWYYIVKENDTRYEVVMMDKLKLFMEYKNDPDRYYFTEWFEKELFDIIL